MLREIAHFLRHGPAIGRRQRSMDPVDFFVELTAEADKEGFGTVRHDMVRDFTGTVLEVGTGTGAQLPYYGEEARVIAMEPDDAFRARAEEAAQQARADVEILPGVAESLPFADASFDAVVACTVLCSVRSVEATLAEFHRVLRPRGTLRLAEHVWSEHWLAGPLMHLFNPLWLRINNMGCNWNRRTIESVRNAAFVIDELGYFKLYSRAQPAAFPVALIKAHPNPGTGTPGVSSGCF